MTWPFYPVWAFSAHVMWVDPREEFIAPINPRKDDAWYKGGNLYAIFNGKKWKLQN